MLKIMDDLRGNVLGVSAEGRITGTDYESVLIPAVEEKLKTTKKIRILYHPGDKFTGFDLNTMLDDAKMGMKHLSQGRTSARIQNAKLAGGRKENCAQ